MWICVDIWCVGFLLLFVYVYYYFGIMFMEYLIYFGLFLIKWNFWLFVCLIIYELDFGWLLWFFLLFLMISYK